MAWNRLTEMKAELVDEHYYKPPECFAQATRYDRYTVTAKVYVGEYAAIRVTARTTCPPRCVKRRDDRI